MVNFYNISIEGDFITARVWNETNNNREDIRAKLDGTYHSSKDTDIIKATWNLVIEYKEKHKLPKKTTVVWG
jgi:hypothetical protein